MSDKLQRGKNGTTSIGRRLPSTLAVPVNCIAAQGELTLAAQPTAGDTMTIGAQTYEFAEAAGSGKILIGAALANTQAAVVAAINGTDGYNAKNFYVTCAAFATNAAVLTAHRAGVAGNSIVTTETFTDAGNLFDAATLGTERAGVGSTADMQAKPMDMRTDGSYLYICTAADGTSTTWKRVALSALA